MATGSVFVTNDNPGDFKFGKVAINDFEARQDFACERFV